MSDWMSSFHAQHPSHADIEAKSEEIAAGLQAGGAKKYARLMKKTYEELRVMASKKKLEGRSSMKKAQLCKALCLKK